MLADVVNSKARTQDDPVTVTTLEQRSLIKDNKSESI